MELGIRKVIVNGIRKLDLDENIGLFIKKYREHIEINKRIPRNVFSSEQFEFEIELLKKRILNSYVEHVNELLKQILSVINDNEVENKQKRILAILDDFSNFKVDGIVYNHLDKNMFMFKKISLIYNDDEILKNMRKLYANLAENINDEIKHNISKIKKELTENINFEKNSENEFYKKSDRVFITEMFGIYFDDEKNCFWVLSDEKQKKLKLLQDGKEFIMFEIDDLTKFVLSKNKKKSSAGIISNGNAVVGVLFKDNTLYYQKDNLKFSYNVKNGDFVIELNGNEKNKFNLNNISTDENDKLLELLKNIDINLVTYFKRFKPDVFDMLELRKKFL